MNRDDQRSAYHATGGTTLSSATQTSTATDASATASTTSTSAPVQPASKTPVATIVGGAVGGALVLAILAGLLIYYCCYAKKSRKNHTDAMQPGVAPGMTEHDAIKDMYHPDGNLSLNHSPLI